jgi:hypothetical protein
MKDKEDNLSITGMERGELSKEELEASMSPEAIAMADQMAEDVIRNAKKTRRKYYSRNRVANDRMNRPEKLKKIGLGMERMYNLIAGKGFRTDAEI